MKKQTVHNIFPVLAILAMSFLTGCAGGDNNGQERPAMGMGDGSRGGKQGPPPMTEGTDTDSEEPPPEAIAACDEKELGDYVEFTTPRGETIKASCQEYEDHLVAVPLKR